ncbi:uncharacterized protein K441DRAFT_348655 [Cenococcum geophilum 1.58]|uniref:uncharacterized protein n=1 Tax=Cenococcum geophilum 1.58 TaxID=794803 RepID=UPI000DC9CB9E|nr:hypothetical protein K441DRAFT_348655 [Cenococcum geophilum 1.58]
MSRHRTRSTCCTVDGDISYLTYRHDGGIQWRLSRQTQLWGWKKKRAALLNPPESFQLSISACPSSRFSTSLGWPYLHFLAKSGGDDASRTTPPSTPFYSTLQTAPTPIACSTPSCLTVFPCYPAQLLLGPSKALPRPNSRH